jgi:hypothetical protein
MAQKFEVGKIYRTRGGHSARLYSLGEDCVDGRMHGAISWAPLPEYSWKAWTWAKDGKFLTSKNNHDADIIPEPREWNVIVWPDGQVASVAFFPDDIKRLAPSAKIIRVREITEE